MTAALHSTGATLDVLRGYLRAEMIGSVLVVPTGRHPPADGRRGVPQDPARAAFHLGRARPGPTAYRKPWYYEHESRPHIAVIGARLSELIGR